MKVGRGRERGGSHQEERGDEGGRDVERGEEMPVRRSKRREEACIALKEDDGLGQSFPVSTATQ